MDKHQKNDKIMALFHCFTVNPLHVHYLPQFTLNPPHHDCPIPLLEMTATDGYVSNTQGTTRSVSYQRVDRCYY